MYRSARRLAVPVTEAPDVVSIPDRSGMLSSLEAVRSKVREIDDEYVDAVLQLITKCACSLTGASGAALALLTDDEMVCRARAGETAPLLGAPVDIRQGLSGECVRSGHLVSCEDTGNDSRIDSEVSRALGIGSLMAAPIVSHFRVVGLLEVFSPHSRAFTKVHETVLDRLVEMIPRTTREKAQPQPGTPGSLEAVSEVSQPPASKLGAMALDSTHATCEALREQEPEVPEQVSQQVPEPVPGPATMARSKLVHWVLLGLAAAVVAMVVGYLVGSVIDKRWADLPPAAHRSVAETASQVSARSATDHSTQARSLADLRRLAAEGDTDAQWQIGVRYHNGEEVSQDDVQAMQWFQRAAEQGQVNAQATLSAYYWAGRGVSKDLSKAYFWSVIALAQGDENSKSRLEGLASQMTQAQVSAARQQAEVWIRTHSQRAKSKTN